MLTVNSKKKNPQVSSVFLFSKASVYFPLCLVYLMLYFPVLIFACSNVFKFFVSIFLLPIFTPVFWVLAISVYLFFFFTSYKLLFLFFILSRISFLLFLLDFFLFFSLFFFSFISVVPRCSAGRKECQWPHFLGLFYIYIYTLWSLDSFLFVCLFIWISVTSTIYFMLKKRFTLPFS